MEQLKKVTDAKGQAWDLCIPSNSRATFLNPLSPLPSRGPCEEVTSAPSLLSPP